MTALRSFQSFKLFQSFQTLKINTRDKERDISLGALCVFARAIPTLRSVCDEDRVFQRRERFERLERLESVTMGLRRRE